MNNSIMQKPSDETIQYLAMKLEEYLSAHNVSIAITLLDLPITLHSSINGVGDQFDIWIDNVIVSSPEIYKLEVHIFPEDVLGKLDDVVIWNIACDIQNQIYRHLKRYPGNPKDSSDPYWKLWDYIKAS